MVLRPWPCRRRGGRSCDPPPWDSWGWPLGSERSRRGDASRRSSAIHVYRVARSIPGSTLGCAEADAGRIRRGARRVVRRVEAVALERNVDVNACEVAAIFRFAAGAGGLAIPVGELRAWQGSVVRHRMVVARSEEGIVAIRVGGVEQPVRRIRQDRRRRRVGPDDEPGKAARAELCAVVWCLATLAWRLRRERDGVDVALLELLQKCGASAVVVLWQLGELGNEPVDERGGGRANHLVLPPHRTLRDAALVEGRLPIRPASRDALLGEPKPDGAELKAQEGIDRV